MSKLIFPQEVLDQHLVMLGKTGSGKSSKLRYIVEHLLQVQKRVCILDPKGDWWGLKLAENGKDPGLPVVMFGDFKESRATDVPINDHSGKHIAELISSGNRPCVIGLRGWTQGAMMRFWIDFASTLFAANAGELYLVGDEFHNFAPKQWKGMSDKDTAAGVGLHWANRLLSEGRGLGLVCLLASQRPQKVHNDTLTSCETLVALRVVHPADREAIKTWIDGNGDPEIGSEVMKTLANLERPEAWMWSPEVGFGPKRVSFPLFKTFDSFAPPQLQKRISGKGWADVDLQAVKEKLAVVIEEAKANDPRELRRQIAELKKQIAKPAAAPATAKEKRVEVPVIRDSQISRLEKLADKFESMGNGTMEKWTAVLEPKWKAVAETRDKMLTEAASIRQMVKAKPVPSAAIPQTRQAPSFTRPPAPAKEFSETIRYRKPSSSGESGGDLPKGERAVLTVAAQYPEGAGRDQITVLTAYKRSSRDAYIQRLRERGYVEQRGDSIIATADGVAALGSDFDPLPTGADLREYWLRRLPEGERKILEFVMAAYPESVTRESIDEAVNYKRSSRDAYIQRLSSRRLVESVGRGEVKAADQLFE